MAAPAAPVPPGRFTRWQARFYLAIARMVQHTIAHRRNRLEVAVRNRAMRAAHRRGIDKATITDAIGLSGQQVGTVLKGKRARKRKSADRPTDDTGDSGRNDET